jgi:hypothetical protein
MNTTTTHPAIDWRYIAHRAMPPRRCAKCGRAVGKDEFVIAPASSKYAGQAICIACLDAPVAGGVGPSEVKNG